MAILSCLSAYSVSLQLAGKVQPGYATVNMASKSGAGATQSPAYSLELSGNNGKTAAELLRLKRSGQIGCQTCQERKYQDGSDDPGVSFKAPGHIAPGSSGSVVMAHEQEHVRNEQANSRQEGRQFQNCNRMNCCWVDKWICGHEKAPVPRKGTGAF